MNMVLPGSLGPDSQADFRQLRHQTKNALARILGYVSSSLSMNDSARRVAAELERRILLTARVSDALFGLTRAPGRFDERLCELCESIVDLASEPDQHLSLRCVIEDDVPFAHQDTVLRVAHELVGNAVAHGMHMRLIGRIEVRVSAGAEGTTLEVSDDGWGCGRAPVYGEGLRVAGMLAEASGGRVTLERTGERTIGRLILPPAVTHAA
ncbi:MAG: sensor histidine kinase [Acetobacteraceae bacterium]|nr:sensor histidine kinase [Acetobacteraceae bacterium]